MELVFGIAVFLGLLEAGIHQLGVELFVHYAEYQEVDDTYEEEHGAETDRGCDGAEPGCYRGTYAENGEHAYTGYRHFNTHCKGHLLSLEPFGNGLRDRCAGHLTAASEHHETEACHLRASWRRHFLVVANYVVAATGEVNTAVQARRVQTDDTGQNNDTGDAICNLACAHEVEGGVLEPVRDSYVFYAGTEEHHAGSEDAGEADAHLVKDDAGYDEETAYVEEIFRGGIGAENMRSPASLLLYQALQRGHHVHEHVAEEHHQGDEDERRPPCGGIVVHEFLNLFCHCLRF